jgi:hypothetical protein
MPKYRPGAINTFIENTQPLRSPKLRNNRLLNAIAYVQIYPKFAATVAIDPQ